MIFVSAVVSQQLPSCVSVPPIITNRSLLAISGARSKCRIDVSQWAGRHYRDVAAVFTDHIDDESHTFR